MQTHIIRIHGEHPRLQWVTPGYTNSSSPLSLALFPSSHTGGIWNLLAAESHRAIKPSKAHKHTRVERQTMLARQAANRHNASWTWTNPSDRFLSCLSLCLSLWTISLFFTNTTWEWVKGEFLHFYPYMEVLLMPRGLNAAQATETVKKVTDEAKTSLSKKLTAKT